MKPDRTVNYTIAQDPSVYLGTALATIADQAEEIRRLRDLLLRYAVLRSRDGQSWRCSVCGRITIGVEPHHDPDCQILVAP